MESERPHRRFNPLTGEWVLVSPYRTTRPWKGQIEKAFPGNIPKYDPGCYLCPGNKRAGDIRNPNYSKTFVFDNDFPALLPDDLQIINLDTQNHSEQLFRSEIVSGLCRVVCFSPRHDLTLPELSQNNVEAILETWSSQTIELGKRPDISYVQVFENKGAMMGCSNPHPHSQIWATSFIPNEPAKEMVCLNNYWMKFGKCILCETIAAEKKDGSRIVLENDQFLAIVPYWAVWPFELLVISKSHLGSLANLSNIQATDLAKILRVVTSLYDNLFEISFPYSMGIHQAPTDGAAHTEAHLHLHFFPPLLRSATIRKFMVGFEMLAMPQRDLSPESAAERLRNCSSIHYRISGTVSV